mgnify:CR=1 FL=1
MASFIYLIILLLVIDLMISKEPVESKQENFDYLILVNKEYKIPDDYLSKVDLIVVHNFLREEKNHTIENMTYQHFCELKNNLQEEENITIELDSVYRTVQRQQEIWDKYVRDEGIDYARKYPNVDMIMGNTMNCKGGNLLIPTLQEPLLINEYNDFLTRMLHHQINLYVWNKLYKRQFLLEHDLLFVDGLLYEDILWTYLLFLHLRSVLILPKVTYYYEYNQSSIVNTSFFDHKADKVISSYVTNINGILDNPPCPSNLKKNVTVDYLLFMVNFLMNGVDVLNKCSIKADVAKDFLAVRLRLFTHSLGYGRLLISLFVLLLFPPLSYLQKFKFFRHHYFDIESIINIIAHFTDFLHRKDKL